MPDSQRLASDPTVSSNPVDAVDPDQLLTERFERVTAIVVTYMTGPVLAQCLNALLAEPRIVEIIIVDNGNDANERDLIARIVAEVGHVRVIASSNVGFGTGANLGANQATGDYLLFVNPDAVLNPDCVERLMEAARAVSGDFLIGGRLQDQSGREQRGARRLLLTPWKAFVSFTGLAKLERIVPALRNVHRERDPEPIGLTEMPVISGALFLVPRRSFDAMGGFDSDYFLHVEDIDLCRTMTDRGGKVYYLPTARALHYGSTSKVSGFFVDWHKAIGLGRYFGKWNASGWGRLAGRASILPILLLLFVRRLIFMTRQKLADIRLILFGPK